MPNAAAQALFTNAATTTLASVVTIGATSIVLAPSTGALFPQPQAGQYFIGTLTSQANPLTQEVVWVTAVSVDTLTVVRAQEGTTALAWNAGDFFTLVVTAGMVQSFSQVVKSVQVPTTGFIITVPPAVATPAFDMVLVLDPAGTLATGTITMPPSPADGTRVKVATSQTVTALTVSANAGQSIKNAPTTLVAGTSFSYIYNAANTTWYRT